MYEPKWQNITYAQNRRILERSAKFKAIIEQRVFLGIKNNLYFYKRIFCQPLLLLLDPNSYRCEIRLQVINYTKII